jgi:hypothetical protein
MVVVHVLFWALVLLIRGADTATKHVITYRKRHIT